MGFINSPLLGIATTAWSQGLHLSTIPIRVCFHAISIRYRWGYQSLHRRHRCHSQKSPRLGYGCCPMISNTFYPIRWLLTAMVSSKHYSRFSMKIAYFGNRAACWASGISDTYHWATRPVPLGPNRLFFKLRSTKPVFIPATYLSVFICALLLLIWTVIYVLCWLEINFMIIIFYEGLKPIEYNCSISRNCSQYIHTKN